MAMFVVLLSIGFTGSFISGMLGIGGSIVKYPLLLYVPAVFGLATFTAHEVSGISAVQVLFASLSGVWVYRKDRLLNYRLILYMGVSILIGSFIGAYGAQFLPSSSINMVYALLATIATIMMFVTPKELADITRYDGEFNRFVAVTAAMLTGLFSGIVGAAGAFILVPVLLLVLKVPTRVTIASSLAITVLSSIGSTTGKVLSGDVLLGPALVMIWASVLGAPLGARFSKKVDTKVLRVILAVLILLTCIKVWTDVLMT
ncbi:sulfite exporter TauE/SafE family protein [Alicyclobacillus sp. SO9]|uniref:sulfite exporter TauE/SafE family protein n=1 Tax=Alicyclobacillus sp. SO9 TaxID=2665646 RepID=UPI0018E8EE84|nr:sulfite exporter TauE/SafE family protein [Alicyclobacillus sp. SO9]QQE81114.1 sulfite exporter TauE/SafE family protein [Alicyclobacillus sp. SO9]